MHFLVYGVIYKIFLKRDVRIPYYKTSELCIMKI